MKKSWKVKIGILILLIILSVIIYFVVQNGNNFNSNKEISSSNNNLIDNYTYLTFLNNQTNCILNGEVYINNNLIGNTTDGAFYLNQSRYNQMYPPFIVNLSGVTDNCFVGDSNLLFNAAWTINDLSWYFDNNQNVSFIYSEMNLRSPDVYTYPILVQGFIRPNETINYFESNIAKYMKNDTIQDINFITSPTAMNMVWLNFQNSWKIPSETLSSGIGDCKDWATTELSLIENYNSSIQCYDIIWTNSDPNGVGHMDVLCHIGNFWSIYDYNSIISQTTLNNDTEQNMEDIRQMIGSEYSQYGLPGTDTVHALVNNNQAVNFGVDNYNSQFINWILNQQSINN